MISLKNLEKMNIAEPYYCPDGGTIKDIHDLYDKVIKLRDEIKKLDNLWGKGRHNLTYGIYFRGQPDFEDKLIPPVGRPNKTGGTYTEPQERNFLHRFRRRSYYHYQRILNTWEVVFLGRHHGLPTRLLDWTSGMYVALYFACKDYEEGEDKKKDCKDGSVWALVRQPDEDYDLNVFSQLPMEEGQLAKDFRFPIKGVKLIYPFYVSPRMTAQASIFTIQDKPAKALEEYPYSQYERKDFDIFHIRKWRIPKDNKRNIIVELEDIGINAQTLFPDLQGLAEGIEQTESMRSKANKPNTGQVGT